MTTTRPGSGWKRRPGGSPWGLRAWLAFAQSKGKKLEISEWGVGRRGDNPTYIQNMYEFFRDAGDGLAHEGYHQRQWPLTLLEDQHSRSRVPYIDTLSDQLCLRLDEARSSAGEWRG